MIPIIAKTLEGRVIHEYVFVSKGDSKGKVYYTTTGGYFNPKTGVTKKPVVLVTTEVPLDIQMYVAYEIMSAKNTKSRHLFSPVISKVKA